MAEVFMNWQELAAAHRRLKADHEALRKLVDQMADAIENHVHEIRATYSGYQTTKPVKRPATTPPPTPAAPAEE